MKKNALLGILIFLYPVISFGENIYSLDDVHVTRESDIIYDKKNQPLTGTIVYVRDETDRTKDIPTQIFALPGTSSWSICHKMELSVKDGKKNGKMRCYDKENTLEKEYNFKNGYLDGMAIEYDTYHPGEVSEKIEYKMNRCINDIHYRNGKPHSGYRAKVNSKQQRVSKVTGLPITELPAKKVEYCNEGFFVRESYNDKGNLFYSEDYEAKIRTYYADNNKIYVQIVPVPEKFKNKADYVYTAYYENNNLMLKLTVKENKAIAGEFYSKDGKKTVLNEQKATDYLMDIALSISLGAQ